MFRRIAMILAPLSVMSMKRVRHGQSKGITMDGFWNSTGEYCGPSLGRTDYNKEFKVAQRLAPRATDAARAWVDMDVLAAHAEAEVTDSIESKDEICKKRRTYNRRWKGVNEAAQLRKRESGFSNDEVDSPEESDSSDEEREDNVQSEHPKPRPSRAEKEAATHVSDVSSDDVPVPSDPPVLDVADVAPDNVQSEHSKPKRSRVERKASKRVSGFSDDEERKEDQDTVTPPSQPLLLDPAPAQAKPKRSTAELLAATRVSGFSSSDDEDDSQTVPNRTELWQLEPAPVQSGSSKIQRVKLNRETRLQWINENNARLNEEKARAEADKKATTERWRQARKLRQAAERKRQNAASRAKNIPQVQYPEMLCDMDQVKTVGVKHAVTIEPDEAHDAIPVLKM